MASETRDLVVVITHGIDHELSSAGLTIALGGMTAGLKVAIFLTSSGVDAVRRGAADTTLGLHTMREKPRLCSGRSDRRLGHRGRQQDA